ncbi:MAG: hypothetical protein AB8F95_20655 [Bacteroidia bacterium]
MKKLAFVLYIPLLFMLSCEDDPCSNKSCGAHGSCIAIGDATICECEAGWEQDANGRCNFFKLDNFPGNYTATEICVDNLTNDQRDQTYNLDITITSQLNSMIQLSGLNNRNCGSQAIAIDAAVSNTNFAFVTGNLCNQSNVRIEVPSGSGSWNEDDKITLDYEIQYYEFGTLLASETCQTSLAPQ